jgi:hypothetical protein
LESKDIDAILEMDWLSKYKALIYCATKSIKLIAPDGKELEYAIEPVVTAKGATNRVDEVWYRGYHVSWTRQKGTRGGYHESAHST